MLGCPTIICPSISTTFPATPLVAFFSPGNASDGDLISGSYTLALEGATYEGSVALIRESEVVAERTLRAEDGGSPRAGSGERLMPAVAECLGEAGVGRAEIARIVCGAGPGRFTSLRVAGSVAKGLAAG